MSDSLVPSWRTRPEKSGPPWLMLAIAGGVMAAAALGGAVVWGVSRMGPRTIPVIQADPRPLKIRPENPGGLVVPNQDQVLLEAPSVRRNAERSQGANARLDAGPEAPALGALRDQAALPAPTPQPESATALATPSVAPPVAAAPPAPARPALAPVANGRAQVQLGALATEEAARAEWDRLARRVPDLAAFKPAVTKLDREGQPPLFRLRAGGLADAAAARALCEAVRGKGGNCVPVGG